MRIVKGQLLYLISVDKKPLELVTYSQVQNVVKRHDYTNIDIYVASVQKGEYMLDTYFFEDEPIYNQLHIQDFCDNKEY